MPQPHTLKINEIFSSIQGEGLRQGEPTIFIRLSGCNLRCDFCDTKYAWEEGQEMSTDQILREVMIVWKGYPADWVCITGGEPLQQDIAPLLQALKKQKFKIQVETNGIYPPQYPVDWYTLSPKPEKYAFSPEYQNEAKEIKLVVTKDLEFGTVEEMRKKLPEHIPLILQPMSNTRWTIRKGLQLLEKALKSDLKNIKLSLQLHRISGIK